MTDTIDVRVRAQSFWYRDGLSEIYIGIIVLFLGVNNLAMHFGNDRSPWYWAVILIYLLVFCVLGIRAPRIISAIRERITYPRIGYAEPGESVRRLRKAIVALNVLAIFGSLVAVRYGGWNTDRWIGNSPVAGGLLLSAIGLYSALRYRVLRYLIVGLFAILLSLAIDIEYPTSLGREIWLLSVGCAFLCAGGVTAWNFVRTAPHSGNAK